ncbi:MAG: hypothetical protein ACI82F_002650 [Planctomycetota bacterium]|jgi:hypothetical protein
MLTTLTLKATFSALATCFTMQGPVPVVPPLPAPNLQPFGNCSFTGAIHSMSFTPGMSIPNTFTSTADPELRKFIIYVPSTYQPQNGPYPVVYMLHGTGQSAQIAKTKTTWNHGAEVLDLGIGSTSGPIVHPSETPRSLHCSPGPSPRPSGPQTG